MPKEPHVPKNAKCTTVRLSREQYEAWHQIARARETSTDSNTQNRTRLNDVLVDGLWDLLKKETGKTPKDIDASLPRMPEETKNNVTAMPKSARKK